MDECISAWKGSDGEYVAEGMPHKTKIAHKQEGVGVALACGETGIILKLDIMEGKEANRRKDFSQKYGKGTAVTLRLTKEYYGHWKSSVCRLRQVNGQNLENAQCVFSKNGKTD